MIEAKPSKEWLMINAGDPMNFYVGHPDLIGLASSGLAQVRAEELEDPDVLRKAVQLAVERGKPIRLIGARLFFTMLQPGPNGIGIVSQLTPISGCNGPADVYVRATAVVFPADVPDFPERLDGMTARVADMELRARAKSVGIIDPNDRGGGVRHQ